MFPSPIMKYCRQCDTDYPATSDFFYVNKHAHDGLYSICKTCKKKYRRHYRKNKRQELRERIQEIKQHCLCVDCNTYYPHYVLDFHHKDPNQKVIEVSQMVAKNMTWKQICRELDKCILLCANCHRERTYGPKN